MDFTITQLHYVAYAGFFSGMIGILGTYVISVAKGDVYAWLPYISDAGGDAPQSTIFSFFMILVALCFLVGVLLCYLIIQLRNDKGDLRVLWLNRLLLLSGAGTAAGMVILSVNPTGHLRKDGTWVLPVFVPHMFGAILMFTSGIGIMGLLLICTFILDYPNWSKKVFYIRGVIVVVGLISGILTAAYCPFNQTDKLKPPPDHPRDYPPGTIVSAISEWIVVLTFMAFTLSFIPEFRKFKMDIKLDYAEQRKPLAESPSPQESVLNKSTDGVF